MQGQTPQDKQADRLLPCQQYKSRHGRHTTMGSYAVHPSIHITDGRFDTRVHVPLGSLLLYCLLHATGRMSGCTSARTAYLQRCRCLPAQPFE